MKKYLVEFTHLDGTVETVEFITDRLHWTIDQYCRNRSISRSICLLIDPSDLLRDNCT